MRFTETELQGSFIITPEKREDERGFFARLWCQREFEARGLVAELVQCSTSLSKKKGTLRGIHFQSFPHEEVKLVRCTAGAIYDVCVDIRPQSDTYMRWFCTELTAENHKMIYVPMGIAHGFLTLSNNSEVTYQMSEFFHPELSRGIRWNDQAFAVTWPMVPTVISARDRAYPDFQQRNQAAG